MRIFSFRSPSFNKQLEKLSPDLQRQAKEAFEHWACSDGLMQAKRVNRNSAAIAVRVSESVRAVGMEIPNEEGLCVAWFFIGSHSDYEKMLNSKVLTQQLSQLKDKIPRYQERIKHQEGEVGMKWGGRSGETGKASRSHEVRRDQKNKRT